MNFCDAHVPVNLITVKEETSEPIKQSKIKFIVPPKEIAKPQIFGRPHHPANEKLTGFEFLRIGDEEKREADAEACRLVHECIQPQQRPVKAVSTVSLPSAALTLNQNTNEKAQGKIGKLRVHKSGRVSAIICGNEYDIFGNQSTSAEEIVSVISGVDFGNVVDEGIYVGSVSTNLRFIPRAAET